MPLDYQSVRLTWSTPQGAITRLRLLRSRYGYCVNETDGDVLMDTAFIPNGFVDADLPSGVQFYYTVFVLLDGRWIRAGVTSVLTAKDAGYSDRLFDLLPDYYKYGQRALSDTVQENEQLRAFMSVFGWGFDYLSNVYDSLLRSHDADAMSVQNLERLAADLGIDYEHAVPARLMRQRVKNSGHIAQQKGTLEGLRNLINVTTGWDADVSIGKNLMLDNDQASFVFPSYDDYSALINYPAGDRVRFALFVYEAKIGTYGNAPTGQRVDNTWWHCLGDADVSSFTENSPPNWYSKIQNPRTNGVSTWETLSLTPGVPGSSAVRISNGITDQSDDNANYRNALYVINPSTNSANGDFVLRSVSRLIGQSSMDPSQPIRDGIPMRKVINDYDVATAYTKGDLVIFNGRAFKALRDSVGSLPAVDTRTSATADWAPIGPDNRIQHAMSAYTHQPSTFSSKVTVPVTPYVDLYDERGSLIVTVEARAYPQVAFDAFSFGWGGLTAGRAMDAGTATWTGVSVGWTTSGWGGGVVFPKTVAGGRLTTTGLADGQVAVTFRTGPAATMSQGIVFRQGDSSNYWRAGRTQLVKVVAGVKTVVGTYSTPFVDNDRLTVKMQGSTITVQRNGITVLTASDAFNNTQTTHGLTVDAS